MGLGNGENLLPSSNPRGKLRNSLRKETMKQSQLHPNYQAAWVSKGRLLVKLIRQANCSLRVCRLGEHLEAQRERSSLPI